MKGCVQEKQLCLPLSHTASILWTALMLIRYRIRVICTQSITIRIRRATALFNNAVQYRFLKGEGVVFNPHLLLFISLSTSCYGNKYRWWNWDYIQYLRTTTLLLSVVHVPLVCMCAPCLNNFGVLNCSMCNNNKRKFDVYWRLANKTYY